MSLRELLRRFADWFRNNMLALHARDLERGGWGRRYGFPASVFYFISVLVFYVVLYSQVVPAGYFPYFVVAFFCVQLILGTILLGSMVRSWGKRILIPFILGVIAVVAWGILRLYGLLP